MDFEIFGSKKAHIPEIIVNFVFSEANIITQEGMKHYLRANTGEGW
jgi:hypothetical protein